MPFSVQLHDRTTLYFITFLELVLYVAFILTQWASTLSAVRLAVELLHLRPRFNQGLEKIQAVRGHNFAPIFALSPDWEKEFLAPSMTCSTADAFDIISSLDRDGKLDEAPQNKKQQIATGFLRDKTTYAGFCLTNLLAGLQRSGTDQPLSSCGHPAPHETCIACFSSWAHCWRSSHPLQRALHGSKISH